MEFNSSYVGLRNDVVSEIHGTNKVILDVGYATGVNGKYLLDKGIAKEYTELKLIKKWLMKRNRVMNRYLLAALMMINIY